MGLGVGVYCPYGRRTSRVESVKSQGQADASEGHMNVNKSSPKNVRMPNLFKVIVSLSCNLVNDVIMT